MDEHTPGLKRLRTDDELRKWSVEGLHDLAAACEIEPADPTICDACAAYLIAQEKENKLNDETNLGPRDEITANPHHHDMSATMSPQYTRPWLFEPGDKVLCLIEQAPGGPMIVSGVVQQIRIPGPVRWERIVQVQLDDEHDSLQALAWWHPDQVERIHA